MASRHRYSSRQRMIRLGGGLALTLFGCIFFAVSQAQDEQNRGAVIAILAILGGLSLAGQGLRGHREGATDREEALPAGPPISAERTILGLLAAWVLPGLGHWIIGRRGKAILFFATITTCFLLGVIFAQGRNLSYERDSVYFLAYMFNAGETGLGWLLTRGLELTHRIPYLQLGFLYTAVACLLNLVAMMDFVATCTRNADNRPATGSAEA
ncbi:MAG: DUF6677 family protein [Planctomycetota bacterium]